LTFARIMRSLLLAGSVICALGTPLSVHARPGVVALEKNQYLRGDFTMNRHLSGFNDGLKSQGEFVLVPGAGLIWQTNAPFPGTTVLGPGGIVNIDADGDRTRLGTGAAQFGIFVDLISSVLAGNWSALENRFHVEFSPPGDTTWQVKLTPFGESAIGGQITDIIATGDTFVQQVRLNKPGGDFDDITLTQQHAENLPLPKEKADLLPKAASK